MKPYLYLAHIRSRLYTPQVPGYLPLMFSPPAVAVSLHASSDTGTSVVPTDIVSSPFCISPVSLEGTVESRAFKGDQGSSGLELTFTTP